VRLLLTILAAAAGLLLAPGVAWGDSPVTFEFDAHGASAGVGTANPSDGSVEFISVTGCDLPGGATLQVTRAGAPIGTFFPSCRVFVPGGLRPGDVATASWSGRTASATYDGTPTIDAFDPGCDGGQATVRGTKSPKATIVHFTGYSAGPLDITLAGSKPTSITVTDRSYTASFGPHGFGGLSVDQWTAVSSDVFVNSTATAPVNCTPRPAVQPTVAVGDVSLRQALRRGLPLTLRCPGGCHASVVLRASRSTAQRAMLPRRVVGRALRLVPAGQPPLKIRVSFSRQARRKLRTLQRIRLTVRAELAPLVPGPGRSITRNVTLLRQR
jgi:hypothetical protein